MDEELLISLVRTYGELYDCAHKQYEDQHRREAAWQEIAKKTQQTSHECRERWKRLRDNYRKARKLRKLKKAQGFMKIKPIKYEKLMAFIDPIIDSREETDPADDDSESASSSTYVEQQVDMSEVQIEYNTQHTQLIQQQQQHTTLERNYEEPSKPDTIVTFFTNLGETVKTFPEDVQIRVKRDIFKVINEAEEEVFRNKTKVRRVDLNVKYESPDFDCNF